MSNDPRLPGGPAARPGEGSCAALRAPRGLAPHGNEVHGELEAMLLYAGRVRDTAGSGMRDVVNHRHRRQRPTAALLARLRSA